MDASRLHSDEGRLEEGLGATETLITNGDDLTVGKLVGLLQGGGGGGGSHLILKVQSHVAQLLLDVTHDLTLSGCDERVATLSQDLHQVVSQVASGQIQTHDGVGKSVTLIDWDVVGHT